jgi:hypothetical protein
MLHLHRFAAAQSPFFVLQRRYATLRLMRCCSTPFCHNVASALHATLLQRQPLRCALRCIPLFRGEQRATRPNSARGIDPLSSLANGDRIALAVWKTNLETRGLTRRKTEIAVMFVEEAQ